MFSLMKQKSVTLRITPQYISVQHEANQLTHDIHVILNSFRVNSMVANSGKFQIIILGSKVDDTSIKVMIEIKRKQLERGPTTWNYDQ